MIPIVIGALGTVDKELVQGLEDLEIRGLVGTIQTTTLLRSTRKLRKVLETCCHSDSAGVKISQMSKIIITIILKIKDETAAPIISNHELGESINTSRIGETNLYTCLAWGRKDKTIFLLWKIKMNTKLFFLRSTCLVFIFIFLFFLFTILHMLIKCYLAYIYIE